jgi:GTP cyclohydrolase I
LTYAQVADAADAVARRHTGNGYTGVYGIPQGGAVPALMVAAQLGLPLVEGGGPDILVVDDLVDSGVTLGRHRQLGWTVDALYRKPHSPNDLAPHALEHDGWLVFPWEADDAPTDAVVRLLQHIGEDPTRDGLLDTPKRVVKALTELTVGYNDDPAAILARQFDHAHDEMIALTGIPFVSMCEHHLLPFTGHATLGYIPGNEGRVVGLSKLARLVECFARRLQMQERLTDQLAQALLTHLAPQGVGVYVVASHSCMTHRGVRANGASMVTSSLHGAIRTKPEARAEFLAMAQQAHST